MATSQTPRLGLSKPDGNELMGMVDRDWNTPMDKIDLNAGYTPCLSSSRPSNPYLGMPIHETDTGKTLVWNGTTWIVYSTKDASWSCFTVTNPTLTTSIVTQLQFSGNDVYNCTSASSVITLNVPGVYMVSANITFTARNENAMNFDHGLYLDHTQSDGTTVIESINDVENMNGTIAQSNTYGFNVGGIIVCSAAGEKVMVKAYQTSGGNYNISTDGRFRGCLIVPFEAY